MMIEMVQAYMPAIVGGLLIGVSALLMLYVLGRVAGISGILWGAIKPKDIKDKNKQLISDTDLSESKWWRVLFIVGLPIGALLASFVFHIAPETKAAENIPLAIAAGVLVGFGTKLGSGCTSGHGVCGIARLSTRSILATVVFMTVGMVTVFLARLAGGLL